MFKWWPWVDLDIFYDKVKFGPYMLLYGEKAKTMDISETVEVYDVRVVDAVN